MDPSCLQGWELIPVGNARGEPGGYRIFLALFYMANENPERADTYPEPPMSDGEPRTGTQYRGSFYNNSGISAVALRLPPKGTVGDRKEQPTGLDSSLGYGDTDWALLSSDSENWAFSFRDRQRA